MVLSLRYGDLSGAVTQSSKLADELEQYSDDLCNKVQQKMYSVEDGASRRLESADYYVKAKIKKLQANASDARILSEKTQILLDTAKRVDEDVKSTIETNQKRLFKDNADLKAPWYQRTFVSFICDVKRVPLIGLLIQAQEEEFSALDTLIKDIRYWYKCEGGKELVGIVLSIAGTVLAVVLCVCAVVFTGGTVLAVIAGVAGIVSAVIGCVNAVTNVITSFEAYRQATGGHPGMARIAAGQDKLSDVLRQTNYHDKAANRRSNLAATGIEITDTVCSAITLVNGAVKTAGALKKFSIKKTFRAICQPRDELGRFIKGKPTIWNGAKSIASKFNIKDLLLGDLNVKNLSRFSKLDKADKFKSVSSLAKAAKGIVDDFDKINEGKSSLGEFALKRLNTGLNQSLLKQEALKTKVDKNGMYSRKFEDTKLSTIIKTVRIPIDDLGLAKLLTDTDKSGKLSNILNTKGGAIKNVKDIIKSLNSWAAPEVVIDDMGVVTDVKNYDSASGYVGKLDKLNISVPPLETVRSIAIPTFIMPKLDFNLSLECRYPYYNIGRAQTV